MSNCSRLWCAAALAIPLLYAANLPRKAPDLTILMPEGKPIQLSQYHGKVVAVCFILTTCPHCQKAIGNLITMQNEYGAKGFQVLASAIEQNARMTVPGFVRAFSTPFPVGYDDPNLAIDFLQHPPMLIPHMPLLAFVDRQGNVREQHEGDDTAYFDVQPEQNMRKSIERLLNEGAATPRKAPTKKK
jgi:Redoxin